MTTELDLTKNGAVKPETKTQRKTSTSRSSDQQIELTNIEKATEVIKPKQSPAKELNLEDMLAALNQQVAEIAPKMQQASSVTELYKIAVNTIREALGTERVLIYQFQETSGTVVAESVVRGFTPAMRDGIPMVVFGYEEASDYEKQFVIRYDDIETVQLTPDQRKLWEQFQIQASLSISLYSEGKIWGVLSVQQCSKPRIWQEQEITFLNQIVRDLLLCLQPLQFQALLQERSDQEQLVARITQKIGQSPNFENLFRFATVEIRRLLKCDRVGIYH